MKSNKDNAQTPFTKKLTELSRKTGFVIWGCGCCGSPSARAVKVGKGAYHCILEPDGTMQDITWSERISEAGDSDFELEKILQGLESDLKVLDSLAGEDQNVAYIQESIQTNIGLIRLLIEELKES